MFEGEPHMDVLDAGFVRGFIRMATDGWNQGWHERNGGNLSYRIKDEEVEEIAHALKPFSDGHAEWIPLCDSAALPLENMANEYLLVTGAGKYFRNMELRPEESMGIIQLNSSADSYRICWGFANGAEPTSELFSHLLNHSVKKAATNGTNRVIYHAHPVNITALTFVLPHDSALFTKQLMAMISECALVFPQGVSVIEWMMPGSLEIARASAHAMETTDIVIWPHHGMFCAGDDLDAAFGLMHTVEKAAEILVKVISMGAPSMGLDIPFSYSQISERDIQKLLE